MTELEKQLAEALRGLDDAYCRAGSPLSREERQEDRKRLIAAREALAAFDAQQAAHKGDTNGRDDGLRSALHDRVSLGYGTAGALADRLFASDDVMGLNAELGLSMDQLVRLVQATHSALAQQSAPSEQPAQGGRETLRELLAQSAAFAVAAERKGEYRGAYWAADAIQLSGDFRAALAQQPAASVALTADDLKEPKNGTSWRVEWWNESARLMLPTDSKLDSFQSYRNGTLMFTIKRITAPAAQGEQA